ncbi:hypothetical protein PTKIN_Ptkin15bG0184600 [Pterospermum kingtungense]
MAVVLLLSLLFFLTITTSIVSTEGLESVPSPTLEFPAVYVFGDSYIDAGNNNFLPTKSRANYLPYGIDFGGVPTGRTSNGKIVVDFIAEAAGLPFPPPMLGMSEAQRKKTLTGVNYGSGGSGILRAPDLAQNLFGHVMSLGEQVDLFRNTTVVELKHQLDNIESFALHLSKSLFFVHMASNDMGLYVDLGRKFDPKNLSQEFSKQLEALYHLGARKFLVNNVSPLGCVPFNRIRMPNRACSEVVNKRISDYNQLLPERLASLESALPGSKFLLGDLYQLFKDVYASPIAYGFTNIKDSCCIDVSRNGTGPSCAPHLEPCVDRAAHVYFDPNHLTEAMHALWARTSLAMLQHQH